jgi:L-lactate dehydrogenase complex protein LldG
MKAASAKNNILKKIRQALATPVPLPFEQTGQTQDFFLKSTDDLEVLFAENFSSLQGRFAFCEQENELAEQLKTLFAVRSWTKIFIQEDKLRTAVTSRLPDINTAVTLEECDASITGCECLIARTGTIVLSSVQNGRTSSVYAPVHICVAYTSQLVFDLKDAIDLVKTKYGAAIPSLITFASGPSRTADIEKTLVTGVHGPKEAFCFLLQ